MSNEQRVYDDRNHNNIVIVPTVEFEKDEPSAKKPKLDLTPEKEITEKCETKDTAPDKPATPKKDANEDSKKADPSCVKKEIKVQSWASSYLQSIGQQAKPRMSLSLKKHNTTVAQPAQMMHNNFANTRNWTPMNLPTRYLYLNPLRYHFQNPTQNACCSATPLNYTGQINYSAPINYPAPLNYAVLTNNPTPSCYSAPQNYSTPINYSAPLNYTAPSSYPTPTNNAKPNIYSASLLNYDAPLNNSGLTNYIPPLNYTSPSNETKTVSNEPVSPQKEPTTPLIDEPISPFSERTSPLNESVTPLEYESISSLSESITPIKVDNTKKIDTQQANSVPENEPLTRDSTKSKERQTLEMEKAESKTKIKLNLIKKKTDRYKKSSLEYKVGDQKDNCKTFDRVGRDKDKNIQTDKHTKKSDSVSSSKEKEANAHEIRSLKIVPKRKFIESHKSDKETNKSEYSRKEEQKKHLSEHRKYHESESQKKKDTKERKHTKYNYNKTKIIEKIKEIKSLYEAKGTPYKKVNYNKPSTTTKMRRSRTPEPVQKKRPRTDSGNADKDVSTKKTSPVKSVVQPIKINYPTSSITSKNCSPERNDAGVPEYFDLRSKLSRANKYFQKNLHSKDNFKDRDNLVVTINQPEVNTEPKQNSPPKVTVTEKKIKSKNKKYKTIKFTIKVLCQDGEGSASSYSDDSEEELNTGVVTNSQNDLSFLDDFNVDEIVDSLKNSQKRSVNIQNKTQSSHTADIVSKNKESIDKLCTVPESRNGDESQVIIVNESTDCIIVEEAIKTENIKIEQEHFSNNINESNDCVILDTVEISKVKTEVFDENDESNDCVILNADSLTNIKTEQDVNNESCMILDNTVDVISIKSEPNDSIVDIKPNIEIKSETLEKSNDCVIVEIDNHPIKIENSINYINSYNNEVDNEKAKVIKLELGNLCDEIKNVTNINGSVTSTTNENPNLLHDEDTMEIPQLTEEPMHIDEIVNTQELDDNITSHNCHPEPRGTASYKLIDIVPEHGEIEIPIVTEAPNVEKTALDIDNNKATETVNENIEQDVSKSNSDTINIKVVEIPNIVKKEPTVISPIKIVETIHNQDINQDVQKTDNDTKVIKVVEIPISNEKSSIVLPIKKEPLIETEIIPTQDIEINNNKITPEIKTASEKNTSAKSDTPEKAEAEKRAKVDNTEVVSKNLEAVGLRKENINLAYNGEAKKKREPIIYVCQPEGLTLEKAIKQEIINNIEPELAHLKPKDSQAIINAVAVKAEEIINTPSKPETSNVKSKDTNKVPSPVATKSVETEKRQVVIVKKKESEELGEIKEQLEARMFEYLHERYTITSLIHEGRFSKIFKCNDSKHRDYAVKLLKSPSDRVTLGVEKENILQKIQKDIPKENLNIIMMINGFGFERRWALLMEYYPYDLKTILSKSRKGFSIDELPGLARQLIMAVMVLRNNQIVHSDIRPSHILLDESKQRLKLCGFDSCYHADTREILPNIGTVSYRPPEVIMGFSASFSIDVWASATVLYEMFTKRKLFLGCFNNQVLFSQLCILGDMPADMIQRSPYQAYHFEGLSFVRRFGNGGMKRQIIHKFFKTQKLYNQLLSSYNFFWGMSNKLSRREDLSKLYSFYQLLEKMLVMDPRRRLPIEFVCADPFINEL